jgi:hypothetical protein
MYFLYLDDSGSALNQQEEYFVLGGICVPESSVRWLSNELEKLACIINPLDSRSVEFHAAAIFNGKESPWNSIPEKRKRIDYIRNYLCVLGKAFPDITCFAYAIHKKSFPLENPVLMAYEDLSSRFNMYLQTIEGGPQRGLIIIDKTSYEAGLQNLAAIIRQSGNRWGSQNREILEVPLFVDSKASRIIQLADHIAYAVFRRYNANDLTYFNCIEDRFYTREGVMHGLVHRQTITRNCSCPACITRPRRE